MRTIHDFGLETGLRKRTKIEDIRRVELVAAAHRVFLVHGLQGMTSARICREAGMSPGILAYYFKGKDEVLFGIVRHNNRILMEDVVAKLRAAKTPWQRFIAVVEGNFPENAFEPNVAKAWLSVCAAAASSSQFALLQAIFYRRLKSNPSSAFAGVLDPTSLRAASLAVGALIDGMWLRKAAGDDVSRDQAIEIIVAHIKGTLTGEALEWLTSAEG
ncbi:transcriptional regulator BetI [Mesorhizobium sp. B2-3-14]|nr:transcriptional regulator BetI [Mesorhizobium sp. B2-4-18]TPL74173.1 transcriptional regulator BetI [Mesorhizobium sp. B2-3-15]TPL81390.1 transcriptional regulator BetI [Mesorhizobium sp. B2-3-14]